MTLLEAWAGNGREVAVLGLARSGEAAVRLLRRAGIPVYASDAGSDTRVAEAAERCRALGADAQVGGHDLGRIGRAGAVVVSPGIPPDADALQAARAAAVLVVAEVDVGAAALAGHAFVLVTGTNGKSTITALAAHVIDSAGIPAVAAGNIGRPVSDVALDPTAPPWIVAEVSSFQLHDMTTTRAAIGVLSNLAPDHLDRYATLEDYHADKARLFRLGTDTTTWVTNGDDPAVQGLAAGAPGLHRRFSVATRADAWFDRDAGMLRLGDAPLLARERLPLLGDHNVANALAVALVAEAAGVPAAAIGAGLASFRALAHRMEPVGEVAGVLYVNDSKATNVASTEVALRGMDRPFVLLLGGRHKGEPYTRLVAAAGERCRAVVAYGEAADRIEADLGQALRVVRAGTFEDVLQRARDLARPGDAILLSPACSSYDMFRNYEERGERFRAAVGAP